MAATSPAQMALAQINDTARHVFAQRRPWSEITDRSAYSKPADFAEATGRIRKNVNYFKVNYVLFMISVLVMCLLTHPSSLFLLSGLGAVWTYLYAVKTEPLVISGREVSEREKLVGLSAGSIIMIFFLTSVGNVLFLGLGLGAAGVAGHGALRIPDDLFLDESESTQSFFGFLKKPAPGQPTLV